MKRKKLIFQIQILITRFILFFGLKKQIFTYKMSRFMEKSHVKKYFLYLKLTKNIKNKNFTLF